MSRFKKDLKMNINVALLAGLVNKTATALINILKHRRCCANRHAVDCVMFCLARMNIGMLESPYYKTPYYNKFWYYIRLAWRFEYIMKLVS